MNFLSRFALFITGIIMIIGVVVSGVVLVFNFSAYAGRDFALTLLVIELGIQLLAGIYGISSRRMPLVCLILGVTLIGIGAYSSFGGLGGLTWHLILTVFLVPFIYCIAAVLEMLFSKRLK